MAVACVIALIWGVSMLLASAAVRHPESARRLTAAAISPDGAYCALVSRTGAGWRVSVLDAAAGRERTLLETEAPEEPRLIWSEGGTLTLNGDSLWSP